MTRRHGFDGMRGTPSACSCRAVAAFALALLAVGLAGMVLLLPAHADAAPRKFRNCTAMHKVYKYGVAKSRAAARKAGRSAKVSRALYLEHRALDRDSDGVACERARRSERSGVTRQPAGASTSRRTTGIGRTI